MFVEKEINSKGIGIFIETNKLYNSDELSTLLEIVRNLDKNQEINIL